MIKAQSQSVPVLADVAKAAAEIETLADGYMDLAFKVTGKLIGPEPKSEGQEPSSEKPGEGAYFTSIMIAKLNHITHALNTIGMELNRLSSQF